MRLCVLAVLAALLSGPAASAADDFLEGLEDLLTLNAFHSAFRVRLSGTLDLEDYQIQQPAPGLLYTSGDNLFNARLTLFLDVQAGPYVYAFVQSRVDDGFDPNTGGAQVRLDEYAVRVTPWEDGRLSLQAGKFATVAGNWAPRHLSWDNPFITAPLPYENPTGNWDVAAPEGPGELLYWAHVPFAGVRDFGDGYSDKPLRIPVIWGPSYATGFSVAGRLGKFDYAAEIKNASLSSRPEAWDLGARDFEHPTLTARVGFHPNQMWNLGFSASRGAYLLVEAAPTLPPGRNLGDYHEQLFAQDVSFEWHHLQIWAEFYEARFQIPNVGDADTLAYYLETRYKLTPQLFCALRWNQQLFAKISDGEGGRIPWSNDLWRIDAALSYRFTPSIQIKLQSSLQHEASAMRDLSVLSALQFTIRF